MTNAGTNSSPNGTDTGTTASETATAAGPESHIAELEAQVKEKENKYLYLYADFENFKKRVIKERSDLIKFGWEGVARELLNVGDNFDRAIQHIPASTDANVVQGLKMVNAQFIATLEKQGVKKVETVGQTFDPNLHEAVETVASNDQPSGYIVTEHSAGYTLHGRLLRAARVAVSRGPGT